jgi:hypothetical protein
MPSCQQACAKQPDQRACVSACYQSNYALQRSQSASRLRAIAEINDRAFEDDIRANPYLTDVTKAAILSQKSKGFPGTETSNSQSGNSQSGAAAAQPNLPAIQLPGIKLGNVRYGSPEGTIDHDCAADPCQLDTIFDIRPQWLDISYRLTGPLTAGEVREHIEGAAGRSLKLVINNRVYEAGGSVANGADYLAMALDKPCYYASAAQPDEHCLSLLLNTALLFGAQPPFQNWSIALSFLTEPAPGPATAGRAGAIGPVTKPDLSQSNRTRSNTQPGGARAQAQADGDRQISAGAAAAGGSAYPPRTDFTMHSYIRMPASLKSFWLATIGKSVTSQRCMSCHAMDSPAKLLDHHGFVSANDIVMVASALTPGEQIHSCVNCHACGPENCELAAGDFSENRWATPTQVQNINWAQIMNDNPATWPSVICNRMVTNLPTPHLREEHFHGDYRLFWAVADGNVIGPGGRQLDRAPPLSYSAFIENFDRWNFYGARCPQG